MNLNEPSRIYSPKLACWIGLNEAIFIQNLDSLLENFGTLLADNRTWYPTTMPFLETEFPFWDRGILKRILKNLRNDGLLRARIENQGAGRFTWHTIEYTAIANLSGPVSRILAKNQIRRQARDSRQADNRPGYVYLCNNPDRPGYKIGLTSDIRTRMSQLGTNLMHLISTNDMLQTEQELHKKFAHCRIDGEWFTLTDDEINSIKSIGDCTGNDPLWFNSEVEQT